MKLRFAFYWAASCGGCEVAVLDINEKILDVAKLADIVLWPVALDSKYEDVAALPDQAVDVAFINGAIRNSEQRDIAELLRRKAKTVVAFGSCACFGGIPALANFYGRDELLDTVYERTPSTRNPGRVRPVAKTAAREGELSLPRFYNTVYKLTDVIKVEYFLPGCPPVPDQVQNAVASIAEGKLPPPGAVLALEKTVCDTCARIKEKKKIKEFKRPHEIIPDPTRCLLEQGIICCGPATRGGCGARCIAANMPCRGCYGPTSGVVDQGAKLASCIATMVDSKSEEEIKAMLDRVVDPAGTFYRFGLADSLLGGRVLKEAKQA